MWYVRTVLLICSLTSAISLNADDPQVFRQQVAPIFERHCVRCHNDSESKGGLSLESAMRFGQGGDSGAAISAGDSAASLLVDQISGEKPEMPKSGPPLRAEEVDTIRRWIDAGAKWPNDVRLRDLSMLDTNWWSLRPIVRPALPQLAPSSANLVRTPVDVFILSTLKEVGLSPSPEADRRVLIRRLYFDLIGLPPPPDEVDAFVADPDAAAYDKLVDRLLAAPDYGERWARHWLDVVHYGDTHGYDKDKLRPNAWPYRDYVVSSLNEDKSYERFVWEQLAGDVLWPDTKDGIVATGFIAAGPWDFIGHAEVPESKLDGKVARHLDRDDMVSTVMNTFVSLTVQCAQCHHHKFDPVRQEHYYSLQAVFAALDRADRTFDETPEASRARRELNQQKTQLTLEREQLGKNLLAAMNSAIVSYLATNQAKLNAIESQIRSLPKPGIVYCGCVYSGNGTFVGTGKAGGKPREIRILHRGNIQGAGEVVGPGTLPVIPNSDWRFELPVSHREGDRRVALARWITRSDNPLTWRSIVNRIWLYHFGRGLVDTPNDFGRMGQQPTHPELLEWLAAEFRDNGQSIKQLHRLIVCSATYRQVSTEILPQNEQSESVESQQAKPTALSQSVADAENRFLWRMNRRKLEAESIRDAVLQVAGKLNRRMFGPAFQDFVIERPEHSPHYEYHKHNPDDPLTHRRSIYRFLVRSQPQPFMNTLDCADPSQRVDKRNETLTALQSLSLLNNRFMTRMSEHFSERLEAEFSEIPQRIDAAFRLSMSRLPTAEERAELTVFAQRFGLANTCRLIFNLNEFAFVD